MNKKAVIGAAVSLFVFTIAIVALLILFALTSTTIKTIVGSGEVKIYHAHETGLWGLADYMDQIFPIVMRERFNEKAGGGNG